MQKTSAFRTGRHCVFALQAHLVFLTKYRHAVLTPAAHATLREIFAHVCEAFGATLVESHGDDDSVQLLVTYPPTMAPLVKLVNSLKGVSSRRLKVLHPELASRYYQGALWSASYLAASGGRDTDTLLREYLASQRQG